MIITGSGLGTDIGSLSNPASVGRLALAYPRFYLNRLVVKFTDSGSDTGKADLQIAVDSHRGSYDDYILETLKDCGVGGLSWVNWRIDPIDIPAFTLNQGSEFVIAWEQPGSETQIWSYEAELLPV